MINMAHAASSSISHQSQPSLNLPLCLLSQSLNGMPQTSNRPSDHNLNCTQGSNLYHAASSNQQIIEAPLTPNIAPTPTNAGYDTNRSERMKTVSQTEEEGNVNRLSETSFKPEHQSHRDDSIGSEGDSGSIGDDELKAATENSVNEKQLPSTDKMANNVVNTPFAGQIGMNPACYTNPTVPVTPDQQMYAAQMSNGPCSIPMSYGPEFLNSMPYALGYSYTQLSNQYNYNCHKGNFWSLGQKGERRGRQTYPKQQIALLEREFRKKSYISRKRRFELQEESYHPYFPFPHYLTEKQIKIWFQNRRMKEKKLGQQQAATSTTTNAGESTRTSGSTGNTSQIPECSSSTTAQLGNESKDINLQHQLQQHPLGAERVSDAPQESQSAYQHGVRNAQNQADLSKIYNHQIQDRIQPQMSSPQTRIDVVLSAFSSANAPQQYPCSSNSGSSVSSGQGPMDPASIATSAAAMHPIYNNATPYYTTQYQQHPLQQAALLRQIQIQSNDYHTNYPSTQQQPQQQQMLQHQQHIQMQEFAMQYYGFNNPAFSASYQHSLPTTPQSHMPHSIS